MRIALIKTSSLGDVVHTLPVVTDIVRALPDAQIDWVVEESFADLPALHPAVASIVPVAIRRWRRSLLTSATRAEIALLRRRLGEARYDVAIDLQGLIKSAWLTRMVSARRDGYSWRCAREPLATLAYDRRHSVDMTVHAIERGRSLAAQALGYPVSGLPTFGLRAPRRPVPGGPGQRYAVLLHATSRADKQWGNAQWCALIRSLADTGVQAVLPWGSEPEREAARRLAAADPRALVPPRWSLAQCATVLAGATYVVGVDTGLTHLAAALDVPTVALFGATPAWRFGPYWTERAVGLGREGLWPTPSEVVEALHRVAAAAAPADVQEH